MTTTLYDRDFDAWAQQQAEALPTLGAWAYPHARQDASKETSLPLTTLPETCPWPLERVLDPDFWPEAGR
jgi:hypothetical protein